MAKTAKKRRDFDAKEFLATIGQGRKIIPFQKKQTIFAQGNEAGAVFYIQAGKVKLSVVSDSGKEATIAILNPGEFFGEGCLAGQPLRMGSATAITDCALLKIDKGAIIGALHRVLWDASVRQSGWFSKPNLLLVPERRAAERLVASDAHAVRRDCSWCAEDHRCVCG